MYAFEHLRSCPAHPSQPRSFELKAVWVKHGIFPMQSRPWDTTAGLWDIQVSFASSHLFYPRWPAVELNSRLSGLKRPTLPRQLASALTPADYRGWGNTPCWQRHRQYGAVARHQGWGNPGSKPLDNCQRRRPHCSQSMTKELQLKNSILNWYPFFCLQIFHLLQINVNAIYRYRNTHTYITNNVFTAKICANLVRNVHLAPPKRRPSLECLLSPPPHTHSPPLSYSMPSRADKLND